MPKILQKFGKKIFKKNLFLNLPKVTLELMARYDTSFFLLYNFVFSVKARNKQRNILLQLCRGFYGRYVKNICLCQGFSKCKPFVIYLIDKKRPTGNLFSFPLVKSDLNTI